MRSVLIALLVTMSLFAAGPAGKWKAMVDSPDGTKAELVFDITITGTAVGGTIYSNMGEMHIIEGKVDGNKIQFVAEFGDFRIPHEGTFTDTEMKLESTMMEQKFALVLKRS